MSKSFDHKNIHLTFSLMSDVHISGSWYIEKSKRKLINGLEYARKTAKNPIDAYAFVGDFVDCMNSKGNVLLGENWGTDYDKAKAEQSAREFESLREIFNNHIEEKAEIIYCLGNHDSVDCNNTARFIEEFSSRDEVGDGKNFERMYRTDLDLDSLKCGMRHCVCKGYHFLCVDIESDYDKTLDFLKKNLDKITSNEPQKYVFVLYHYKAPYAYFGADAEFTERAIAIDKLLSNYPQAILLSGHTHTTVYNERAIAQGAYTAVDCSCVSYVSTSWRNKHLNVTSKLWYTASEGLLVEVDKNGNIRITRLDYANECTIRTPWEISAPCKDKSHLTRYTENRRLGVLAPEFSKAAKLALEPDGDETIITIPKAVINTDNIFRYQVTCYNGAAQAKVFSVSSLFCYKKAPEYDGEVLTAKLPLSINDIYKISVTAQDFWLNESEPLVIYNT